MHDRRIILDLIDGRQAAAESFKLTSGAASNHVFTLGEFYALYLLSWSDVLWPDELPKWSDLQTVDLSEVSELDEAGWNEQLSRLNEFRRSLPFVRHVLANCPALMIFDDHEVTDDWHLSHGWASGVYTNAGGSRVLFNGLLAYLLFQHWGNRPAPFQQEGTPEHDVLTNVAWSSSKRLVYEKPAGGARNSGVQFTASSATNSDSLTMALHVFGDLMQRVGMIRSRTHHGYSALSPDQRNLLASPPPAGTELTPVNLLRAPPEPKTPVVR